MVYKESSRPKKFKDWMVADGMLYKFTKDKLINPLYSRDEAWRLVVPVNYREQVLREGHDEVASGHFGREKTYDRIAREYYWPGMYFDIKSYCAECTVCQKYSRLVHTV